MIRIRKMVLLSFCIFLMTLIMCVSGTFSYAENEDFSQEFYEWQSIVTEKWVQFEKLDLDSEWFTAYILPADVYAFYEMPYEQDVCSFLILGKEKALLWDTGMGIEKLRPHVEKLTDLPIIVLNSHDHFDHIGGNAEFDEVWCYDIASSIQHLSTGPDEEELEELTAELKMLSAVTELPDITVPDHIPGKAPTATVKDGQMIDLGGRAMEVWYTPGHDTSSIMLLDRKNKMLFTGDTYYPGPLYIMFDESSFPDYVLSVRKAAERAVSEHVEWVLGSHNYVEKGTDHLCQLADFLERIQRGEVTAYETEDGFCSYEMDKIISVVLTDD